MKTERTTELITKVFALQYNPRRSTNILCDLKDITQEYENLYQGTQYNFNYYIKELTIRYYAPGLLPKKPRKYSLQTSEAQSLVDDIEYARLYNEKTPIDSDKKYASKVTCSTYIRSHTGSVVGIPSADYFLFNEGTFVTISLKEYLPVTILESYSQIDVKIEPCYDDHNVTIWLSIEGNVTYTRNVGVEEIQHFYP